MSYNTIMEYKGFKASIKEAERLTGDYTHNLPPGNSIPVYHSEAFLKYPENWMKGPGVFVIPVKPNKGLWFDWTMNDSNNTAILPTVKGCNPITGLQTSGFFLERYDNKCPKHGCNFEADRYCPECDYKWAPQNYICSPNTLWWDGFRTDDGTVRQFFFTEEMMRDIATAMIGKENTVPAFGFAFYSPKERRPEVKIEERHTYGLYDIKDLGSIYHYVSPTYYPLFENSAKSLNIDVSVSKSLNASNTSKSIRSNKFKTNSNNLAYKSSFNESSAKSEDMHTIYLSSASNISDGGMDEEPTDSISFSQTDFVPEKEVAVGAGAKIRQSLNKDSYPLESWKEKPDAVMTLYFVFQSEFEKMAAGGIKNFEGKKEGMLNGLPVG